MEIGAFGNREDPAERVASDFAVHEFCNFQNIGTVFADPVVSGKTAIENAFLHIAGHFLSTDQHAFDFRVVNGGEIRAGIDFDLISGLGEHIGRRLFQTSFGKSEHQFICHIISPEWCFILKRII